MSVTEKLHLIELKVMRLTLPTFNSNMFFCGETRDYGTDILKKDLLNEFICSEYDVPSSVGVMLKLPQTFGTIYLGETFKAYVTVHNLQSDQKVFQIILNIYIQTGTQKINIYNPDIIKEIDVNNNYDQIIQHEVKELGSHVLVCEVTYSANEGQTMHFRKFFKFQVNKPLDVKTKFYNSETGKVFLETQVQNLTNHPLVLEQMALFPHSNYIVKDANYDNNNEFIFNKINCLNPMDVRQYLFCLYIKKKPIQNKETLTLTDVGKLHISWRGPYGEKGALQTSQLHRLPSQIPDILLQVETIPDQIEMEKSFALNCRITNFTLAIFIYILVMFNNYLKVTNKNFCNVI
ncbi:unnamed protein product [Gordionus sp. m RMFG-2023]